MNGFFAGGLASGIADGMRIAEGLDEAKQRAEEAKQRQEAKRMAEGIRAALLEPMQDQGPAAAPGGNPVAGGISAPQAPPATRDLSVDDYANIYRDYSLRAAGNPYAAKAVGPALEYVRNAGMAKAMAGFTGDPSTMEGALDLYHQYGRASAMFGQIQDPTQNFNMARQAEAARMDRESHGFNMQQGQLQLRAGQRADREGAYQEGALADLRGELANYEPGGAFGPYAKIIDRAAKESGVRPDLLSGLIQQESSFNPKAVGDGGSSVGLGQFNVKGALAELGLKKEQVLGMPPEQQIPLVAKFYRMMIDRAGGDQIKGLKLYNGGGDPNYVPNVLQHLPRGNREARRQAIANYKAKTSPDTFKEDEGFAKRRLSLFQDAYQLARAGDINGAIRAINEGDTGFSIIAAEPTTNELPNGVTTPDYALKVRDDVDGEVRDMQMSQLVNGLGASEYQWEMRNVKTGRFGDQETLVAVKKPKDGASGMPQVYPLEVPDPEAAPKKRERSGPSWFERMLGGGKDEETQAAPAEAAPAPKQEAPAPKPAESKPKAEAPRGDLVKLTRQGGQLLVVEGNGTRPLRNGDRFLYRGKPVTVRDGEIFPDDG